MRSLFCTLLIIGFCFSKPITISGTIFTDEGKPSRKAEVILYSFDDLPVQKVKTNRKGKFEFLEVLPNHYFLVANHPDDGKVRIKINPRKKRNRDLLLRLNLKMEMDIPMIYTFSNVKPIKKDPDLRIRKLKSEVGVGFININWKSSDQAIGYEVFKNGNKLKDVTTNFFKDTLIGPGEENCYQVMAIGKYGLTGIMTETLCRSSILDAPNNLASTVNENRIMIKWNAVKGASKYIIYRNNQIVGYTNTIFFNDDSLEYSTTYSYQISSIDSKGINGLSSDAFKITTREYVSPPTLSSYNNEDYINLIWNEVDLALSYNLYRNGALISTLNSNNYKDPCPPGERHCYQIASIDKYSVESDLSEKYCSKLYLKSIKNLDVIGGIRSNQLSWEGVIGYFDYNVYVHLENDSIKLINKTKQNLYLDHQNLDYDEERCYSVTSIDIDGDESGHSKVVCAKTYKPPHFEIKNYKLIEPSGNNSLDSREKGVLRFAIVNSGESPSKKIKLTIIPIDKDQLSNYITIDTVRIVDDLNVNEAKYFEFNVAADLKVNSGDWRFLLKAEDKYKHQLKNPFEFSIRSKAVDKPNIILADYAIENSFGTNYIPKSEDVNLIIRIQNVGSGLTENVNFELFDNHTYNLIDFNGYQEISVLNPGEHVDLDFKINSEKDHFSIKFSTIDYLDNSNIHKIDLELMKHYRSKVDLMTHEIGASSVIPYPVNQGELEIEKNIPVGKRNPNGMAIIIAIDDYDDISFNKSKFSSRSGEIFRLYTENSFGLDDYQIFPSKPWQISSGPEKSDIDNVFDPHQGIIRNRVISSNKYSKIDFVDINIFYTGLGMWIENKPYLIPRDGINNSISSLCSLEKLLKNLSQLSVLENIRSITLILDIKYINSNKKLDTEWEYPEISKKMCILSASSIGETSIEDDELKHSIFSYYLFKGLMGDAKGSDDIIEIGEIAEYLYRKVPNHLDSMQNKSVQNPTFIGSDLSRIFLDLR